MFQQYEDKINIIKHDLEIRSSSLQMEIEKN